MENVNEKASEELGPLESAIKKENIELVDAAISQIPEKYREPLVLYYRRRQSGRRQSVRQVAQLLDLSEEVVKKRIQRGREKIKEQLSSIVEETLSATGPKKVFTTAVIASVTGMVIKGSGVAAAAYPDGREFVGVGIIPDIEINPTQSDIAAGRDVVLEKGIDILKSKSI